MPDRGERATEKAQTQPSPSSGTDRQHQVRATLRLLFNTATADALVQRYGDDMPQLLRGATRQWWLLAWKAKLRRSRNVQSDQPLLSPASRLTATSAIALATHLGLGMTVDRIASEMHTSPERIGLVLHESRLRLTHATPTDCGEFSSALGRYRDASLSRADRASLLRHLQRCDACRVTVEQFQSLDAQLLEQIDLETTKLAGSTAEGSTASALHSSAWWAAVTTIVAIALIAGIFVTAYRARNQPATAATSSTSPATLSGWILTRDDYGQLNAIDLTTGQRHPIGTSDPSPSDLQYGPGVAKLSPDHRLIAVQRGISQPQLHLQLTIETVLGENVRTIDIPQGQNISFAGWMGNTTVLEVETPLMQQGRRRANTTSGQLRKAPSLQSTSPADSSARSSPARLAVPAQRQTRPSSQSNHSLTARLVWPIWKSERCETGA